LVDDSHISKFEFLSDFAGSNFGFGLPSALRLGLPISFRSPVDSSFGILPPSMTIQSAKPLKAVLLIPALALATLTASAVDFRGAQFIDFKNLSTFTRSAGEAPGEWVYTSKEIRTSVPWTELVASWNLEAVPSSYLKIEVRALHDDHLTKYYTLGLWSPTPETHPLKSVPNQKDADGDVVTDTLKLKHPAERAQVRLTLGRTGPEKAELKLLTLAFLDPRAQPEPLPPNRAAWNKTLDVPERSQMAYPNGGTLCSPTTVSMLLAYWAQRLKRPDLDHDVPEIVPRLFDSAWDGAGNWPFNTAYAGSFRGMRGYVTRLTDVSELEDWIAAGIPVGISVCYNRLRGRTGPYSGHLVVCVGFTAEGDPIINDPGTRLNVRKTFLRKNLVAAWAYSHHTAYLIYPESIEVPADRFGHWDSWTARQRARLTNSD